MQMEDHLNMIGWAIIICMNDVFHVLPSDDCDFLLQQ